MSQTNRRFLLIEGASFILAALAHAGVLVNGYEDAGAATAESVIGVVLLVGLGLTWAWPSSSLWPPGRGCKGNGRGELSQARPDLAGRGTS
jgi:hypothetical protein